MLEPLIYVLSLAVWFHGDTHKTIFVKFFVELSFENLKSLSTSGWLATDYCPFGLMIRYCIILRLSGGAKLR